LPAVGLAIGAAAAGVRSALRSLDPWVQALAVAALLAAVGGGAGPRCVFGAVRQSLAGRGTKADGAGGGSLQTMAAWAGVIAEFVLKAWAIASLSHPPGPASLFAPMFGRWAMVVCAYQARDAARTGSGAKFHREVRFREFGWSSAFALGVPLGWMQAAGVTLVAGTAAAAVALRLYWHRRIGGVDWDVAGATGEVVEAAALLSCAAP